MTLRYFQIHSEPNALASGEPEKNVESKSPEASAYGSDSYFKTHSENQFCCTS